MAGSPCRRFGSTCAVSMNEGGDASGDKQAGTAAAYLVRSGHREEKRPSGTGASMASMRAMQAQQSPALDPSATAPSLSSPPRSRLSSESFATGSEHAGNACNCCEVSEQRSSNLPHCRGQTSMVSGRGPRLQLKMALTGDLMPIPAECFRSSRIPAELTLQERHQLLRLDVQPG